MDTTDSATKAEFAYRTLRQDILEARLRPGVPLRLGQIRETYGMGWTPLREALSRLEAEHLVTSTANKGFTVAMVSMAELRDLTEARRLVELPMLTQSIAHGDVDWETALVAAHFRLSRCKPPVENPEDLFVSDWETHHTAFHFALVSACKSPWQMRFYLQIHDHLRRHHRALTFMPTLDASKEPQWHESPVYRALRDAVALEPHTELMNAAIDRDVERAVLLLDVHIELTKQVFAAADTKTKSETPV